MCAASGCHVCVCGLLHLGGGWPAADTSIVSTIHTQPYLIQKPLKVPARARVVGFLVEGGCVAACCVCERCVGNFKSSSCASVCAHVSQHATVTVYCNRLRGACRAGPLLPPAVCAPCVLTWLCACLECKHKKADLLPERDVPAASQVHWLAAVVAEGAGGTTPDVVPQHCVVCVYGVDIAVCTHMSVFAEHNRVPLGM